jgi:hypothetical protein
MEKWKNEWKQENVLNVINKHTIKCLSEEQTKNIQNFQVDLKHFYFFFILGF